MDLRTYHGLALRTAKMYPTLTQNLNHAALGLATEFLESLVADNSDHFMEEIGDYCWYLPLACHALGTTLDQVCEGILDIPVGVSIRDLGIRATGNFITMVKRVAIYEKTLTADMRQQAISDIRQMVSYAAAVSNSFGFLLATALDFNIAKLRERFPGAYSNEAAEARADKAGLDARVS